MAKYDLKAKVKEQVKQRLSELKGKVRKETVGQVNIENVKAPKKKTPIQARPDKVKPLKPASVSTGSRGGTFIAEPSGHKRYVKPGGLSGKTRYSKSVKEILKSIINEESVKGESMEDQNVELMAEYPDDIEKAYVGFDKLVEKLKNKKNPPKDAEATAAAIGRKKYGKQAFQAAAAKHKKMNKALEVLDTMAKSEEAQSASQGEPAQAQPAPEQTAAPAAPEEPQVKLAPGLFQGFTLGSTLKQGPKGNIMSNVKAPMMDYEKTFANSSKNKVMTEEELSKLPQKK